MNNFETLNDVVEKNGIKPKVLAVYGLDNLYQQAKNYTIPSKVSEGIGAMPDIIYEDNDPSFCSVFSDGLDVSVQTQITDDSFNGKLHSEGAILSSEFEYERSEAILTSDKIRD